MMTESDQDSGQGKPQPQGPASPLSAAQPAFAPRWPRGQSLGTKFFVLGLLVVLLSIPVFMVWLLVLDRQANHRAAVAAIGAQWGGAQTLTGPLLAVPVTVLSTEQTDSGRTVQRRVRRVLVIAPDTLEISGRVHPERRRRGIHEAIVYQTELNASARFVLPALDGLVMPVAETDWARARIVMALSDLKGIEAVVVSRDGEALDAVAPGFGLADVAGDGAGFHVPVDLSDGFADAGGSMEVDVALSFKGSQSVSFTPVGRQTSAGLASEWPHPSFSGAFLPASRSVSDEGFEAQWSVPQLARSIPAATLAVDRGVITRFAEGRFGVDLYQPVDFYRYVDRAVKYGVLFVGAAFLVIFAIEVMSGGRMHLAHYMMTGLMMILFYVLLLALAEIVGFATAYAIAAGATGAVVAGFTASLFPGRVWALSAAGGFALLYGVLYVVLSLEDAALLAGAVTGFVILTAMMFGTRKVDWSAGAGGTRPSGSGR
jgi:inner membrane protein